jgi:hypothetical protein
MSEQEGAQAAAKQPKRGVKEIVLSYFYWTYPRGCFHYDVMVTLILAFIFITPHLWSYGDRPQPISHLKHPMQVMGVGGQDEPHMIVTIDATDVQAPEGATPGEMKRILRKAIEPVTGDAVFVDSWQTTMGENGVLVWKVKAHR